MPDRLPRAGKAGNGKPLGVPRGAIEADFREAAYLNQKPGLTPGSPSARLRLRGSRSHALGRPDGMATGRAIRWRGRGNIRVGLSAGSVRGYQDID